MAPVLRVRDIEASYGRTQVLWGVSFDVQPGEIFTVIGPNGSGKTTLMRVISRIHPNTAGSVELDGRSIDRATSSAVFRSGLVQVPEQRGIFGTLTVRENMLVGADWRADRDGVEQDMERYYKMFPRLLERSDQRAGTLSGGEQQMLAVARGLMARPRLLILDEPSVGLAPRVVSEIFKAVRRLKDIGITILLVEQFAKQALLIADHGIVLESGRVAIYGDAAQLMSDEAVAAAYLGRRKDTSVGVAHG